MRAIENTIIDDTVKPAIEWINGRAVQKLMPTDRHAILQLAFARFLDTWAKANDGKRGKVGPEWRFIIPPNSYKTGSLVPDIAYLSNDFDLTKAERTIQEFRPTSPWRSGPLGTMRVKPNRAGNFSCGGASSWF